MDADIELKLKKVVFWELVAIAVLVLAAVIILLVVGNRRKAQDPSVQTGTSETVSSGTFGTADTETGQTQSTETTVDTTEDTTASTQDTTEESTEDTTETTEETTEETTVETTEETVEETTEETIEETTEEETEEPESSEPPATDTTLPPLAANPIRPEDITQNGTYLTCLTTQSVVGIDVSEWQGSNIDWALVKAAGIEFVMIRVGYRGYESGTLNVDTYAQRNYEGASAAGLKIGAYFYSQAINVREAEDEAAFVLDIIKDWQLDMPVVYDWEYVSAEARTGSATARTVTDCTKAFCNKIKAANLKPMVYFSTRHVNKRLYLSELTDYDFWFVQYSDALDYPYKVDMWQYTDSGSVPGIAGNVDINLYFPWEE